MTQCEPFLLPAQDVSLNVMPAKPPPALSRRVAEYGRDTIMASSWQDTCKEPRTTLSGSSTYTGEEQE